MMTGVPPTTVVPPIPLPPRVASFPTPGKMVMPPSVPAQNVPNMSPQQRINGTSRGLIPGAPPIIHDGCTRPPNWAGSRPPGPPRSFNGGGDPSRGQISSTSSPNLNTPSNLSSSHSQAALYAPPRFVHPSGSSGGPPLPSTRLPQSKSAQNLYGGGLNYPPQQQNGLQVVGAAAASSHPPSSVITPPSSGFEMAPPPPTSSVPRPGTSYSLNQRYPSTMPPGGYPIPQLGSGVTPPATSGISQRLGGLSLQQGGDCLDLLQNRHILPAKAIPAPKPRLQSELWTSYNCSPDIFRSTLTKIPETETLLKKSRLPLGILIHPFRDLSHLPVIQCASIVRCRQCRTYVNPFVHFIDNRRWRCNICYRVNELPEEFLYDPVSKSYGDPSRRPECKSSTIEFIAPSEYMLRPPQPAVYLFLLDVSRQAVETGYVKIFCDILSEELDKLPGDSRTQIAFITYERNVHFYSMPDGCSHPTQLVVSDIDDMFLPTPCDLLVNLQENKTLVLQLLSELPNMFAQSSTQSALGPALQAAYKMASPTGGRVTVFQHILPSLGPGALTNREHVVDNKSNETMTSRLLGPSTDFYKKLALDCSGQQIAVDLFSMGSQYQDLATLSGISKFSGGQIQHFPGYHILHNIPEAAKYEQALRRYLTRKIGFEAVMRVRCTRGLTMHSFHGNFFVRSTDLLSLPNVNPDAGFGMLVSIEDDLRDSREVTFQAALLYTSSRGERRIRVHTLCLPTSASVSEIINGADQVAVMGMLVKFAADRATTESICDAKDGLVVSCVDAAETYKNVASINIPSGLLISKSLRLMPLYVLACLRSAGFRNVIKADERTATFCNFKSLPLLQLIQSIYPDLYKVDDLSVENEDAFIVEEDVEEEGCKIRIPQPSRLQLSFERISATGMYLLDIGDMFYLYVSRGLPALVLEKCFGVMRLQQVDESMAEIPENNNELSENLRTFINWLNGSKPYPAPIRIIREDGRQRHLFVQRMIEDRYDGSLSYFEFLQHMKQQIK